MKRAILVGILFLLILGVIYVAGSLWSRRPREELVAQDIEGVPQEGDRAPDFTLLDLDGKEVSLSDYKGRVIFLNFWASWCPPCRAEMPSMEALYQKLKNEDFELLAVSLDRGGKSLVEPFVRDNELSFPILLDSTGEVGSIYGVRGIPATFILDRDGVIVEKVVGKRDWASEDSLKKFQSLISKD